MSLVKDIYLKLYSFKKQYIIRVCIYI